MALFMYENTTNISYMYYTDDHENFPDLSFFVDLKVGPKVVIRYLHVRRRDSKPGSLDKIINIFDDVSTSQLTQPNSIAFFLASVTHELYQGCVVNYFLQKRGVDLKPGPGNWIEYKVKTYPISKVRKIYY